LEDSQLGNLWGTPLNYSTMPNGAHDAEWSTVTKRNQKGKLNKKKEIPNLKKWNVIPEELTNLMVAPKVNDHHGQEVHNKTMQKICDATKSQQKQIMKTADFEKVLKEIKKTDPLLIKESEIIEEGLKQAKSSTKQCAELLLVKKDFAGASSNPKWNDFLITGMNFG
jgi:hypothetical protein